MSTSHQLAALNLRDEDVLDLALHVPSGDSARYFYHELQKRAQRRTAEREHQAQLRKALRLSAIEALIAAIDDVELQAAATAALDGGNVPKSPSQLIRDAYTQLFDKDREPTLEDVVAFLQLHTKAAEVEASVKSELGRLGKDTPTTNSIVSQLYWTYSQVPACPATDWLDTLMQEKATIAQFLVAVDQAMNRVLGRNVGRPQALQHPACACGNTAAQACPTSKCGKCCQGCTRHKK